MPKEKSSSSKRRTRLIIPKQVCEATVLESGARSGSADTSKALPSITKHLGLTEVHHGGSRDCKLSLPGPFCDKHNVADHVTMADSTGQMLWHMHCQSRLRARKGKYVISNGWREFVYDHGLKRNDKLVFTLASPSHFVVEYATAKGCARVMRPTRDGTEYPWTRLVGRSATWRNFSEKAPTLAALATTGLPSASKQRVPISEQAEERMCQCKAEDRENNYKADSTQCLPELTHIECNNPDGTSYLQILDSGSEVTSEDEENPPE